MKKNIALLLALAMCFSLCACGNSADVTTDEVVAIVGTWTSNGQDAFEINADGTFVIGEMEGTWIRVENSEAYQFNINGIELDSTLESIDGFDILLADGSKFVRSDYYDAYSAAEAEKVEEIEITIDNWQEFFTLEKATRIEKNGFDEVEHVFVAYYLMPKDEILSRLVKTEIETKPMIAVETSFDWRAKTFELDGDEIVLIEEPSERVVAENHETYVSDIYQRDVYDMFISGYDYIYNIGLPFGNSIYQSDGTLVFAYRDNWKIERIQGTLLLYK